MPKKTKILFVLESYFPNVGGVENLFKLLAEDLVKQKFQVCILTTRVKDFSPQETVNGVAIKRIPISSRYLFTFFAWIWGIRLAKDSDIIHTTSYNAALPAFVLSRIFQKQVIITFHEYWGNLWNDLPFLYNWQRFLYSRFEQFIARLPFDRFIAVSDFTRNALIYAGVPKNKIERIYNGIDYEKYQNTNNKLQKKEFVFLFSGRAGVSKGLNILADAIHDSQLKIKNFKLIIHSSDDRQFGILKQIEEKCREYGIVDKVAFDKNRYSDEGWNELVSKADCVVIPSYSEGFSFVAVEVCTLGIPVIHSGNGALSEVVSGKFLVFENMDSKDLALKMQMAMEGKFVEAPLKKFRLEDSVAEYVSLYSKL